MKIRSDFVTNSSSGSYITIIADFKNGPRKKAELKYDQGIPAGNMNTEDVRSGKELPDALDKLYKPFFPRGKDPSVPDKEYDANIARIEAIEDFAMPQLPSVGRGVLTRTMVETNTECQEKCK